MAQFMSTLNRHLKLTFANLNGIDSLLSQVGLDLEELLETLGSMIEMSCAEGFVLRSSAVPTGLEAPPLPPDIDPFGASMLKGPKVPTSAAVQLQRTVHRAVIKEYRTIPSDKVTELYRPLFDLIFSKYARSNHYCLPIFTTNYDPSIEAFVQHNYQEYDVVDGFQYIEAERREGWNALHFDNYNPLTGRDKRHLLLFKLHGSADWILIDSMIRRAEARYVAEGDEHWNNCLIYPAKKKVALQDPYFTCYDYLTRCFEKTQTCLTIGYSFRDYDALMRLRAAIRQDEKLNLLLVSPNATEVVTQFSLPTERILPIDAPFGVPGMVPDYLAGVKGYFERTRDAT
jgi:hypothetical protein